MLEWLKRKMGLKKAMGTTTAAYDPSLDFVNSANLFGSNPDSGAPINSDDTPCDTGTSDDPAGSCDSGGFDGGGGDAGGGGASGDS